MSTITKKKIIDELEQLRADLARMNARLAKSGCLKQEGTLIRKRTSGKMRFYCKKEGSSQLEYLGSDKTDEVRRLAGKLYVNKLVRVASSEMAQIDRCLNVLQGGRGIADVDDVYPGLPEEVRNLVEPEKSTFDGYARWWQADRSKGRSGTKYYNYPLKTARGETVKSKSEVIIADRLDAAGVPYVYEYKTVVDDEWAAMNYPDFYVLNKRTGEEFFWEHFGKMDDERYCQNSQLKLEKYAQRGLVPGKNLILSFEGSKRALSTEYVDFLIKSYLL